MDAGKINSLIHSLRTSEGGAHAGPSQGDAAFAAKMAAAALLDGVLQATESEPTAGPGIPPQLPLAPRNGVVVNLSTGVVAAEMAARLGTALPRQPDHAQTKPEPSHNPPDTARASASAPARVYSLTERLGESLRASVVTSGAAATSASDDPRAPTGVSPALAAYQAEPRQDLYPFLPPPMATVNRVDGADTRSTAAAAIEQARESERLAGLNAKAETREEGRPLRLDRLVLAALALGVLVVLFL
jgi:hypothetical protein